MIDNELGLGIVFNGCIYNFRDLRTRLRALGYHFFRTATPRSSSRPTPPGAWIASITSRACLRLRSGTRLRPRRPRRDRLGIKPLYYAETAGALRFASTLPACWPPTASTRRLTRWRCMLHVLPRGGPGTPHNDPGCAKLPPATVRMIERRRAQPRPLLLAPALWPAGRGQVDGLRRLAGGDARRPAHGSRTPPDCGRPVGVLLSVGSTPA